MTPQDVAVLLLCASYCLTLVFFLVRLRQRVEALERAEDSLRVDGRIRDNRLEVCKSRLAVGDSELERLRKNAEAQALKLNEVDRRVADLARDLANLAEHWRNLDRYLSALDRRLVESSRRNGVNLEPSEELEELRTVVATGYQLRTKPAEENAEPLILHDGPVIDFARSADPFVMPQADPAPESPTFAVVMTGYKLELDGTKTPINPRAVPVEGKRPAGVDPEWAEVHERLYRSRITPDPRDMWLDTFPPVAMLRAWNASITFVGVGNWPLGNRPPMWRVCHGPDDGGRLFATCEEAYHAAEHSQ